jgi:3-hydroxyacyl-CoA dehydrogenase
MCASGNPIKAEEALKFGIIDRIIEGDLLVSSGGTGKKTGAGWYIYDEQRRTMPDPQVAELVQKWVREAGIAPRQIAASEIIDRCIYALVNEGARILQEGYALRASDIDIICLNGYGFPAHRCGPMWYADTVGLKKGLRAILRIASPAWRNLAARAPTVATRRTKQDFRRFRQGRGAAA